MMRLDKFTVKAQEAVQAAQSLADQGDHQAIEPEHLLLALLQQHEGVVGPLLAKLGARPEALAATLEAELAKLPKVRGGGRPVRRRSACAAVLERAQDEAERLKDEYVSTEHLLIGIAQDKRRARPARVLAAHGVTPEAIYQRARRSARQPARHRPEPRGEVPGAPALLARPDRSWPARASSTRSSAATRRSAASSRCSRAAPRTTRC